MGKTQTAAEAPLLWTARALARQLGVARATVYRLVAEGRIPPPVHVGRSSRWRRREIEAWVNAGCPSLAQWRRSESEEKQ